MQEGCSVFENYSGAHRFVHDSLDITHTTITSIPAPYKIYVFTWAYMYNNQVKETETWLQSTSQIAETETVFLEFLMSYITSFHVCSHSNVPLSFPMLSHAYFKPLRRLQYPNHHWGRGKSHKCFKICDEYCRFVS